MPEERIESGVENLEKLAFKKKLGSPSIIIGDKKLHPEAEEVLKEELEFKFSSYS
jgi:hypothetical protein